MAGIKQNSFSVFNQYYFAIVSFVLVILQTGCATVHEIQPTYDISDAHGGGSLIQASSGSDLVASGGWGGRIRIWSLRDGRLQYDLNNHDGSINGLRFIQNDRLILSASYDRIIRITMLNGTVVREKLTHSPITAFFASEPDNLILTGHKDGSIHRWDFTLAPVSVSYQQHSDEVRAIAYDSNKKLIASSDADSNIVFQNANGDLLYKAATPSDLRKILFTSDGKFLYGSGWFNIFRWDTDNFIRLSLTTEHQGIVVDMLLDSKEQRLFSISRQTDSSVLALDPASGNTLERYGVHNLCGSSIGLSYDNRYLITSSDDASIRIWDMQN